MKALEGNDDLSTAWCLFSYDESISAEDELDWQAFRNVFCVRRDASEIRTFPQAHFPAY